MQGFSRGSATRSHKKGGNEGTLGRIVGMTVVHPLSNLSESAVQCIDRVRSATQTASLIAASFRT